jgi:DNA mismatch repair protein MutL
MPEKAHIRLLDPLVAQRIAAGEVIDRPAAVLRELLDNALDSGATSIEVYIEQGGIDLIKVMDNGGGMDSEDLALCCRPHATSKVTRVEDLEQVATLGFRGEALASIAVCSDVTISSRDSSGVVYTLHAVNSRQGEPVRSGHTPGTSVTVKNLFHAVPGRKKFLKSPQAESAACKKVFIEKALAFPDVEFKYTVSERLVLFLPAAGGIQRIMDAHPRKFDAVFFDRIREQAGSFSLDVVCSTPSLYRSDRSFIQIFINNRRVDEYALVQAVGYGYSEYLPGGCFPYAFVFITVDPQLVDVNIHPAKREVKLRNGREIHQQLVHTLKQHLSSRQRAAGSAEVRHQQNLSFETPKRSKPSSYHHPVERQQTREPDPDWFQKARRTFTDVPEPRESVQREDSSSSLMYYGQLFNLFLLVSKNNDFFFIDQHAAHERIIYNQLSQNPGKQQLLVPIEFEVDSDVDDCLADNLGAFSSVGITLQRADSSANTWQITTLPQHARIDEKMVIEFIQHDIGTAEDIAKELFATIACRSAVKDGDMLDRVTAEGLARKALELPTPRCPHGRPVWKQVSRDDLFEAVRRTF